MLGSDPILQLHRSGIYIYIYIYLTKSYSGSAAVSYSYSAPEEKTQCLGNSNGTNMTYKVWTENY